MDEFTEIPRTPILHVYEVEVYITNIKVNMFAFVLGVIVENCFFLQRETYSKENANFELFFFFINLKIVAIFKALKSRVTLNRCTVLPL